MIVLRALNSKIRTLSVDQMISVNESNLLEIANQDENCKKWKKKRELPKNIEEEKKNDLLLLKLW